MKIKIRFLAFLVMFALVFSTCDLFNDGDNNGNNTGSVDDGNNGNNTAIVGPLLKTKWAQESPYNDLFPIVNGERKPTNCETTAKVQIMAFHKYPARGNGESSVVGPGNISVPLTSMDVAYDWDNMLNEYTTTE